MIKETTLKISPEAAAETASLRKAVARSLGVKPADINDLRILRRSVDARKRPVALNLLVRVAFGGDRKAGVAFEPVEYNRVPDNAPVVVIVGAGPAGLFAALECIRTGVKPIVLERGRDVDTRRLDLASISRKKRINPESNYCFGEGGAGAYSDGKLYTRSKKRGENEFVLRTFVQHGASENILVDAHPHIGSDRLPHVIKAMRQTIIDCGGEVEFGTKVTGLAIRKGIVTGVVTPQKEYEGSAVIMATGHSARDTYRMLHASGVDLEAKGLAIGVRLEHPQDLIDRIQYHSPAGRGNYLPAAEYSFVTQSEGRGVYSFCMCPGGVIVPAGSGEGELVVNGMSASARSGRLANSGMVVEVHPGDIPGFSAEGPLEMLALQESLEKRMFAEAGNTITAPAQRMLDFVEGKTSDSLPPTSYAPGVTPRDFNKLLPPFIARRLADGFRQFGSKSKGFLTNEAMLVGLESRTSSPVRVTRDKETLESTFIQGLYPAGEGAGYAGGIVSAAVDGIRCARAAAERISRRQTENKE